MLNYDFNRIFAYNINYDQISIKIDIELFFRKLFVYDAIFNNKSRKKIFINNCTSILYYNENTIKKFNAKIIKIIKSCVIKLAKKHRIEIIDICMLEMKLKDLSKKTIVEYIFSLKTNIDLILDFS